MDAAVVVAMIALVATLANVGVTYLLTARSERRRAAQESELMWSHYRGSLASAADELAARIGNILKGGFLDAYGVGVQKDEAILSTMFRFAQYFGWGEIIRRSARAPDPHYAAESQLLGQAVRAVADTFATDSPYGAGGFMLWREAQRAIGELMITREGEVIDTLGVAGFMAQWDELRPWLHRMQRLMESTRPAHWEMGERDRLNDVQASLMAIAHM